MLSALLIRELKVFLYFLSHEFWREFCNIRKGNIKSD